MGYKITISNKKYPKRFLFSGIFIYPYSIVSYIFNSTVKSNFYPIDVTLGQVLQAIARKGFVFTSISR